MDRSRSHFFPSKYPKKSISLGWMSFVLIKGGLGDFHPILYLLPALLWEGKLPTLRALPYLTRQERVEVLQLGLRR